MESKKSIKINCFIVGSMKCGTTSLSNYLDQHPDVKINKGDSHLFLNKNSEDIIQERINRFYQPEKMNIDKSASYSFMLNNFKTILKHNEEAKFIWLLRDPLKRAYSNYVHCINRGLEKKTFYSCFKAVNETNVKSVNQYFLRSKYSQEIERALGDIKETNILFLLFEDFIEDPNKQLDLIHKFLNLPSHRYHKLDDKKKNSTYTSRFYRLYPILKQLLGRKFVLFINSYFHAKNKLELNLSTEEKSNIIHFFRDDYLYVKERLKKDISKWNEF